MPEISRFFGILIAMFDHDHPPPHLHVRYGKQRAILDVGTLSVLEGSLSRARWAWAITTDTALRLARHITRAPVLRNSALLQCPALSRRSPLLARGGVYSVA